MPTAVAAVSPTVTPREAVTSVTAVGTWVVDDDKAQCPHARFRSIQAAIDKANAYDVIKICAGRYAEQVTVDKPLEIEGDGAALLKSLAIGGDAQLADAVDCFSPTRPSLDASTHVIVAPPLDAPSGVPTVLFDLQANDIKLEGLALLGNDNTDLGPSRAAVETSAAHSGYEIQYNLFLANTVAAFLNSNGDRSSSFHHNCLRENGWGVSNNLEPLIDARVHHNSTFRTRNSAYEATHCDALPCTSPIGMDRVTFDDNVSTQDDSAFLLSYSASTSVLENSVSSARVGARMLGNNEDLDIVGNDLEVRLAGIPQGTFPANRRLLIQGNTISGAGTAAGIGMGAGALKDSQILDNVVSGLDGEGIALLAGNTGNLVRGNIVLNSGRSGIRAAAGATGNTFELNEIHGSGRIASTAVDARDDAWPSNVWRGNACETDVPAGAICGVE
jgi:hypothetical protein